MSGRFGHHRGIAAFVAKWTLFAHRSLLLHCTSRETDGGTTDRVIDAFAPFEGLALRYIEDDRSSCSIGVLMAFNDGAAETPSERPSWRLAWSIFKK